VPLRSYSISLAENATPAEHFVANELAGLLGNMTNGDQPLPVIAPAGEAAAAGPILAVGTVASVKAGLELSALEGLGEEGFVVSAAGLRPGCLAFAGGAGNYTRGVLFAVYHFLEVLGTWPRLQSSANGVAISLLAEEIRAKTASLSSTTRETTLSGKHQ
jgi:hypothetical protein